MFNMGATWEQKQLKSTGVIVPAVKKKKYSEYIKETTIWFHQKKKL